MDTKSQEYIVSVSPHIRDEETVRRIMWTVSIALLPALRDGRILLRPARALVTAITIAASVASEWIVAKMAGRTDGLLTDGSAVLTGLLLALNLPASAPIYIPIVSAFVAVGITKQLFGGFGFNIFNPALVGRAFALITWPRAMTSWIAPTAAFVGMDAKTTATPLGILKEDGMNKLIEVFHDKGSLYWDLFLGHRAGSLGETSVIAILIGAAFLLYKRYITWHTPFSFLATVAIVAWIAGGKDASGHLLLFSGDPVIHVLSGGLMLGAFFMATDYVTAPSIRSGQVVFGIGCGLITMLIRLAGGFPEGVMFAILLMNCFTPLIDRKMRTVTFGFRKPVEKKA